MGYKIVCTISKSVQTGVDVYVDNSVSKVFDEKSTIGDIVFWAEVKGVKFQEILMSDLEE